MKNKLWVIIGVLVFSCFIFSNTHLKAEPEEKETVVYSYNCFEVGYFTDNNEVFYYDGVISKKLMKADIKTFRQIHSSIGRDEKNVYYGTQIIKGLDRKTLEIYSDVIELEETEPAIGCYPVIDIRFKDKNGVYIIKEENSGKMKLTKYE